MRKIVITVPSGSSEDIFDRICNGFSEKYGECEFEKNTDPDMIGGFTADIDGEIVDASVRTQLRRMQRFLGGR